MTQEFEGFQTLYAVTYTSGDLTANITSNTNLVPGAKVFENLYSASTSTNLLVNGDTGTADLANNGAGVAGSFTYIGAVEVDGNYVGILIEIGSSYYLADVFEGGLAGATNIKTTDTLTIQTGVGWDLQNNRPMDGPASPACFLAGTAVRTPSGDVPVESLEIGDPITLSDGRTAPVRWLGVHTVSMAFADKLRFLPIRIKAHALGDNLPRRDLLLSSDHALLVDGVLIQAGALVNDTGIVREHQVPATFRYFHVEVADHALLLAENVPAETFVDNVDRMAFDNWAEHQALYPDAPAITEIEYHRARARRQVPPATRARLSARGAALYGSGSVAAA
jgi:hypothetical protein